MAFKLHNMRSMAENPIEYYQTTDNEAIALGEALVLTSGYLTKCGATATPEFIALKATADLATIPVIRVQEDDVFETTFSTTATSIVVGDAVTLHTDGLQVTATTSSGVFEVKEILGGGVSGTGVRGMFRR